jgi:hypothetical protein
VAVAQAGAVEGVADRLRLVGRQVVHDHDRVGAVAQGWRQDLLHEGQEHRRAGRRGDAHAGDHAAVERERADDGEPLPAPPGHLAGRPPPARGAGVGPRHAGVDAGLVDEDEAPGIDPGQLLSPRPACLGDVLALLLGRPERLFLRPKPSALSARHRADGLRRMPVRPASWAAYSASVASFRSATSSASTAASPPTGGRPPSCGLGVRRPVSRASFSHP